MSDLSDMNVETVSLEEGPTTFLARVKQACPDILSIITTKKAKLLTRANESYDPESVNQSYLSDMGAYVSTKIMQEEVIGNLATVLLKPLAKNKTLNIEESEAKGKILKMVALFLKFDIAL